VTEYLYARGLNWRKNPSNEWEWEADDGTWFPQYEAPRIPADTTRLTWREHPPGLMEWQSVDGSWHPRETAPLMRGVHLGGSAEPLQPGPNQPSKTQIRKKQASATSTKSPKKSWTNDPRVLVAAALLLVVLLAAKCLGGGGTFTASIDSFLVLNDHQILAYVKVTNTGSSAGSASCDLTAHTPDQLNAAGELFQTKSLNPGQSFTIQVTATVTGNAANQIRQSGVSASC